jgi:hypothetical protein
VVWVGGWVRKEVGQGGGGGEWGWREREGVRVPAFVPCATERHDVAAVAAAAANAAAGGYWYRSPRRVPTLLLRATCYPATCLHCLHYNHGQLHLHHPMRMMSHQSSTAPGSWPPRIRCAVTARCPVRDTCCCPSGEQVAAWCPTRAAAAMAWCHSPLCNGARGPPLSGSCSQARSASPEMRCPWSPPCCLRLPGNDQLQVVCYVRRLGRPPDPSKAPSRQRVRNLGCISAQGRREAATQRADNCALSSSSLHCRGRQILRLGNL